MPIGFSTGVTGPDGGYLAGPLIAEGWSVTPAKPGQRRDGRPPLCRDGIVESAVRRPQTGLVQRSGSLRTAGQTPGRSVRPFHSIETLDDHECPQSRT
jgi:hypothetical protein